MKFHSIGKAALPFAVVAGLGMAPAQAADLGGDCCADLEERIAELEATTVRKGNRVVSLKLSGHVNRGVMWWDNGRESNVYAVDNGNSSTRFRLSGNAKISHDITAGFFLEIGVYSARTTSVDENNDDAAGVPNRPERIALRKANWYLNSKTLGKLTVGTLDMASDDIAEIDLGGINAPGYHNGNLVGGSIGVYTTAGIDTGVNVSALLGEQTGDDIDGVRYDSPTIMGFKVSAAWGEDDMWDVALRYANEIGDFRVAAGIGYFEQTDFSNTTNPVVKKEKSLGGSFAVMHTPTGLWVDVAYSERDQDRIPNVPANFDRDRSQWAVSAGITQKFIPLGKTTFYAQYSDSEGYQNAQVNGVRDEANMWGLGFIQHVDAASMQFYVGYRNFSFDLNATDADDMANDFSNTDDVDVIIAGAKITF